MLTAVGTCSKQRCKARWRPHFIDFHIFWLRHTLPFSVSCLFSACACIAGPRWEFRKQIIAFRCFILPTSVLEESFHMFPSMHKALFLFGIHKRVLEASLVVMEQDMNVLPSSILGINCSTLFDFGQFSAQKYSLFITFTRWKALLLLFATPQLLVVLFEFFCRSAILLHSFLARSFGF